MPLRAGYGAVMGVGCRHRLCRPGRHTVRIRARNGAYAVALAMMAFTVREGV